jgi:hypothetical protein
LGSDTLREFGSGGCKTGHFPVQPSSREKAAAHAIRVNLKLIVTVGEFVAVKSFDFNKSQQLSTLARNRFNINQLKQQV